MYIFKWESDCLFRISDAIKNVCAVYLLLI